MFTLTQNFEQSQPFLDMAYKLCPKVFGAEHVNTIIITELCRQNDAALQGE